MSTLTLCGTPFPALPSADLSDFIGDAGPTGLNMNVTIDHAAIAMALTAAAAQAVPPAQNHTADQAVPLALAPDGADSAPPAALPGPAAGPTTSSNAMEEGPSCSHGHVATAQLLPLPPGRSLGTMDWDPTWNPTWSQLGLSQPLPLIDTSGKAGWPLAAPQPHPTAPTGPTSAAAKRHRPAAATSCRPVRPPRDGSINRDYIRLLQARAAAAPNAAAILRLIPNGPATPMAAVRQTQAVVRDTATGWGQMRRGIGMVLSSQDTMHSCLLPLMTLSSTLAAILELILAPEASELEGDDNDLPPPPACKGFPDYPPPPPPPAGMV